MNCVDSIAIKFLESTKILCGNGNQLVYIENTTRTNENTKPYDKIHSIAFKKVFDETYLIISAAGREILISNLYKGQFKESQIVKFNDWISSVHFLDEGFIILTAHNFAMHCKIQTDKSIEEFNKLKCPDNTTLYCSAIHGNSWNTIKFLTGSALGELLVWTHQNNIPEILFRMFAHNGSIFSIDFDGDYLTTSSDDRSIKIFKIQDKSHFTESKQFFGHTARVFVCKIIQYNGLKVVSGGEDGNVCIWNLDGTLLKKKYLTHLGTIWNIDYDNISECISVCGSVGNIHILNLNEILFEIVKEEKIVNSISGLPIRASKMKYLSNGILVVLDNLSHLYYKSSRTQHWKFFEPFASKCKCVHLDVVKNSIILTDSGSILIFEYEQDHETFKLVRKIVCDDVYDTGIMKPYFIRSLHVFNDKLLTCNTDGECVIFDFKFGTMLHSFIIPASSERWTTSALNINNIWLIGDRTGNMYIFDEHSFDKLPRVIKKVHGNLGITSFYIDNDGFIRTTGHDGNINIFRLNTKNNNMELYRKVKTQLNCIDKYRIDNDQTYYFGFNDNYFSVSNNNEIIYEYRCGGRHRNWDIYQCCNKKNIYFSYINKSKLFTVEFHLVEMKLNNSLAFNWHLKECNKIALKQLDNQNSIIVSGGEDVTMKFTWLKYNKANNYDYVKSIDDMNIHISSIKQIIMNQEDDDLWIFSCGARAQIVVTRLIQLKYIKEELNYRLYNSTDSQKINYNPDTKFNCMHYSSNHIIYIGCSDGYIRMFQLHKNPKCSIEFIKEIYYGRCILHITVIQNVLITMATDGYVCFWNNLNNYNIDNIVKIKHNQSGINCFDIRKTSDAYLLVTSGDDTEIHITKFKIENKSVIIDMTLKCESVHYAQVTEIKFLSENSLISASIDQTICSFTVDYESGHVKILKSIDTDVADVKGFEFIGSNNYIVYGSGMQILER